MRHGEDLLLALCRAEADVSCWSGCRHPDWLQGSDRGDLKPDREHYGPTVAGKIVYVHVL